MLTRLLLETLPVLLVCAGSPNKEEASELPVVPTCSGLPVMSFVNV